jgi:hypothetical protein
LPSIGAPFPPWPRLSRRRRGLAPTGAAFVAMAAAFAPIGLP